MDIERLVWDRERGWSAPFPALDSEATLVVVFGDRRTEDDVAPIGELVSAFPRSQVIGCSAAGEIAGTTLRDGALSVAIARFDKTRLAHAGADVVAATGSAAAGAALAAELSADGLRAVFVLSDGLQVNGSELVRGLLSGVGPEVTVTGGLAGDGDRFERTWVLDDGMLRTGRVAAVGFYGDAIRIGHGSRGGWGIFGPERVVTRSAGNVLYELDGKPALSVYKRYLGALAEELPATALLFPLAVRAAPDDDQVVRTVLAVDEADQSMTFAGDVPQGARAQLMRSSPDRLVEGAACAGEAAARGHSDGARVLAIAISCVGRRLVLGERTEDEIEATYEAIGRHADLVGYYSYGEIAPGARGYCDLHNQTMTVTTLAEC